MMTFELIIMVRFCILIFAKNAEDDAPIFKIIQISTITMTVYCIGRFRLENNSNMSLHISSRPTMMLQRDGYAAPERRVGQQRGTLYGYGHP